MKSAMNEAYDTDFAEAVRKCAATLQPSRVKGEYKNGDELAAFLRSDRPLTRAERELLAQLVTGELQSPQGRPEIGVGLPYIAETVSHFMQCRNSGDPEKVALGKAQKFLKENHDKEVSDSQLRSWIADTKDRQSKIPK